MYQPVLQNSFTLSYSLTTPSSLLDKMHESLLSCAGASQNQIRRSYLLFVILGFLSIALY